MAGDQSIANSAQDVRLKIGEFAAKLKQIHDELGGRIDDLAASGAGLWVGNTPPTDLESYKGWVNTSGDVNDLLYNAGTLQAPDWVSILSKVKRPSVLGTPYPTLEMIGERTVWAVDLSLGYLPNAVLKLVAIPTVVLSSWGVISERWVDTSTSYAYNQGTGKIVSLPYTTTTEGDVDLPYWNNGSVYTAGSQVYFNETVYEARWYSQGDNPEQNSAPNQVWLNLGTPEQAGAPRLKDAVDVIETYIDDDMIAVRTTSDRTDFQGVVTLKYLLAQ